MKTKKKNKAMRENSFSIRKRHRGLTLCARLLFFKCFCAARALVGVGGGGRGWHWQAWCFHVRRNAVLLLADDLLEVSV